VRGARLDVFLFDLDGTLIDSIELIRLSLEHTLAAHGFAAPTRAEWLEGLGRPLAAQFRRLTTDPVQVDAMVRTYRAWNLAHHDAMVRPYEGVHAALDALAAGGGRLGVVTSKQHVSARRGLERCGLGARFEVLVAADDVDQGKPAPDPVLLALERLGARPQQAVFVGDSPHDLTAGREAGTRTAAVLWGPFAREDLAPHRPDVWVERPADLAGLAASPGRRRSGSLLPF
jgi:pyrophosphatase PpaX